MADAAFSADWGDVRLVALSKAVAEDKHLGLVGTVLALLSRFHDLPYEQQVAIAGLTDKVAVRLVEILFALSALSPSPPAPALSCERLRPVPCFSLPILLVCFVRKDPPLSLVPSL